MNAHTLGGALSGALFIVCILAGIAFLIVTMQAALDTHRTWFRRTILIIWLVLFVGAGAAMGYAFGGPFNF